MWRKFDCLAGRLTLASAVLLLALGAMWWRCETKPEVFFLNRHAGAKWILYPLPPDAKLHNAVDWQCKFRKSFFLPEPPSECVLTLRAFARAQVTINGRAIAAISTNQINWKLPQSARVSEFLRPGTNEISVTVINPRGPPALWLKLDDGKSLPCTDETWNTSLAGAEWRHAVRAGSTREFRPGNGLYCGERPITTIAASWPQLAVLALIAASLWIVCERSLRWHGIGQSLRTHSLPTLALFTCLALWCALAWNNAAALHRVPIGYDALHHLEYIQFILNNGRLPFGNEGFEAGQAPLYYLICAGVLKLARLTAMHPTGLTLLRVISLFFGITHLVCAFFTARMLFPDSRTARMICGVLAGFTPMLLYMSSYITNEAPMAVFVAAAVVICVRLLRSN